MEDSIVRLLGTSQGRMWTRQEIFNALGVKLPKKEANSYLYRLKTRKLLERIANPDGTNPRWFLALTKPPVPPKVEKQHVQSPPVEKPRTPSPPPAKQQKCEYCSATEELKKCAWCEKYCCRSVFRLIFFIKADFDEEEEEPDKFPVCLECYRASNIFDPDKTASKKNFIQKHTKGEI